MSANEAERQLVVWAPDFLASGEESAAQKVLRDAVAQFTQETPSVTIELQQRAQSGTAGMLAYLRSAQKTAPLILPDLVLLDANDLWQVVDLGLVQPLNTATVVQFADFYPFALRAAAHQGQLYGIPYAVDILHVASGLGTTIPTNWNELLAGNTPYLFPGALVQDTLNDSLLLHYVAAGGELTETGAVTDREVLVRLFDFYTAATDTGLIPADNWAVSDPAELWRAAQKQEMVVVDVRASLLLRQRDRLSTVSFGSTPSFDDRQVALGRVWVFAILTDEPQRQAEALAFVRKLLEPSVQGNWTQLGYFLPSTRGGLATWGVTQPYEQFVAELMEGEVAVIPGGRVFQEWARRLNTVQVGVLTGELSVEEATVQLMLAP